MARLFQEHILRKVQSLDGTWNFRTDSTDCGEAEGWSTTFPRI